MKKARVGVGARTTSQGEVEVKDRVNKGDEVGIKLGARAMIGLEYGGASQSEYSESDNGLYFESDDSEIDALGGSDDELILHDNGDYFQLRKIGQEVGMVREAALAIDAVEENINEGEDDEDIEAYEDLNPSNCIDKETFMWAEVIVGL
ncbi:hypothetical protein NL676_008870 [Syzygium grande]|nr:hypothetical protein NL676_008870 [Syzygium grande]